MPADGIAGASEVGDVQANPHIIIRRRDADGKLRQVQKTLTQASKKSF